jgi:hypothetical protein
MNKTELYLIAFSVVSLAFNIFLGPKVFRFKDALWTLILAAKDGKVNEAEFQQITDQIKKDLYG